MRSKYKRVKIIKFVRQKLVPIFSRISPCSLIKLKLIKNSFEETNLYFEINLYKFTLNELILFSFGCYAWKKQWLLRRTCAPGTFARKQMNAGWRRVDVLFSKQMKPNIVLTACGAFEKEKKQMQAQGARRSLLLLGALDNFSFVSQAVQAAWGMEIWLSKPYNPLALHHIHHF